MDKDKSGSLDPAEVARGFKRLGVDLVSESLLDEILAKLDVNQNGLIEASLIQLHIMP